MRMKTVKALRATAQWAQRILDVQLPMATIHGLRTR